MPAQRRRIIAIAAALTVFAAVGVFWLTRVVLGGTGPEFVAVPPATTGPSAGDPSSPNPSSPNLSGPDLSGTGSSGTDPGGTDPGGTDPGGSGSGTGRPGASSRPPGTGATTPRTNPATRSSPPASATSRPAPPVPTHAIRVGGATLDNDSPRGWCAIFDNTKLGLAVTVTTVGASGELRVRAGDCAGDDQVAGRPACRDGMQLRDGAGCFAETITDNTAPGNYPGTVSLGLSARCTSIDVPACDVAVLRASPPTPGRPAVLTWTDPGRAVCYRVAPAGEGPDPLCRDA